jgi:TRAP-type C4-dicarboxylate transport system permease small subunit
MAGALALDVGARLWGRLVGGLTQQGLLPEAVAAGLSAGGGVLGAPQVAVLGMIALASFGAGLAAQQGAELRARFLEGLVPSSLAKAADRLGDAIAALILGLIGALCAAMAVQSFDLGDVGSVLGWPIWPAQSLIAVAFLLNAGRYAVFALVPALRPALDAVPETEPAEPAP